MKDPHPFALRRPWLVLGATLFCVAVLGVIGLRVDRSLEPTALLIEGTPSAQGQELAERYFGHSSPFVVLLRGPAATLDAQGPRVLAALRREPGVTALGPWDRDAVAGLRPAPGKALVLLDFKMSSAEAMREAVPGLEARLERSVRPPLRATQSGYASISRGLQRESLAAAERAELLAMPLLIIVLLLVFRSAIAAAIPLAFGALTVFAGRGVLVLLSSWLHVDALSVVVCTMMGLALGVDYSLLSVSRFREELRGEPGPAAAALRARQSAGRTTVFAGTTLFVSVLLSAFLQAGSLLISLAWALVVVTAISVAIAWFALPALFVILGERVNALPVGRRRGGRSRIAEIAAAALRRPARSAALVALPLFVLAAPAAALRTGAPGVDELAAGSPVREDVEVIDAAVGPGWEAPFVLVATSKRGPVTSHERLAALASWQARIGADPRVQAVIGPAPLASTARELEALGERLGPAALARIERLGPGLGHAASGVGRLRDGLAAAAAGGGLLGAGAGRAKAGASEIAAQIELAGEGGERARGALGRLQSGAEQLAEGQERAASVGFGLALDLGSAVPNLRGNGLRRARRLRAELERAAREDPSLRAQAELAAVLVEALASSRDELRHLRTTAGRLNRGLTRLATGGRRLGDASGRLAAGAARLAGGLDRLGTGTRELASGLGALQGGAGSLQRHLASGHSRLLPLQQGLRRAGSEASETSAPLARGARRLAADSPGFFRSGYLTLSALDGAEAERRRAAGEAIDLDGGGAARLVVVTDAPFNSERSRRVGEFLAASAESLEDQSGMRTALTGGAAILNDYGTETKARLPLVLGALVLITFAMLVMILRAPLLAALAVGLNLVSVAAALGVMALVCRLPAGVPLGGHPYIDTVGGAAIFGVTFGLSIDYAVFLLARMGESWRREGDNREAISFGLERTAGVITGAAAIMAAVFITFATAPIATVSQMGVGLAVAIQIDATAVRIVLLPALMILLGDRVWRVPPLLDRVLPRIELERSRAAA